MSQQLRLFLRVTDVGMLAYWVMAACLCLGLLSIPADFMYDGYGTLQTDAWNWSFAPLDIAFAVTGLTAVRLSVRGDPRWRAFALASLLLTMCAGGMAIAYWTLLGDFKPAWWIPNLALFIFPLLWMPQFFRNLSQ